MNRAPKCYERCHFVVTWEAALPYLCRVMGFKSKRLLSIKDLEADGQLCRVFIVRDSHKYQREEF